MGNAATSAISFVEIDKDTAKKLSVTAWSEALWEASKKNDNDCISVETFIHAIEAHENLVSLLRDHNSTSHKKQPSEREKSVDAAALQVQSLYRGNSGRKIAHKQNIKCITSAIMTAKIVSIGASTAANEACIRARTAVENAQSLRFPPQDLNIFPIDGVPIALLLQHAKMVKDSNNDDLSVKQVCELFIKPKTRLEFTSFTNVLRKSSNGYTNDTTDTVNDNNITTMLLDSALGHVLDKKSNEIESIHSVSKATHFVSYSQEMPFIELVEVLQNISTNIDISVVDDIHDGEENSRNQPYFWIDIYCVNLHTTSPISTDVRWLTNALPNGISTIDNTIFILYPWHKPFVLHEIPCLLEAVLSRKETFSIYLSATEVLSLENALCAPTEELSMCSILDNNNNTLVSNNVSDCSIIDNNNHPIADESEKWSSHHLQWLRNIEYHLSDYTRNISYSNKGTAITRELLQRMKNDQSNDMNNQKNINLKETIFSWYIDLCFGTLLSAGRQYMKVGTRISYGKAAPLLSRAAVLSKSFRSMKHPGTWLAHEQLSECCMGYVTFDNASEAEYSLRNVLHGKLTAGLKASSTSVISTRIDLGISLKAQNKLVEAQSCFTKCLKMYSKHDKSNSNHPLILKCIRLLAAVAQSRISETLQDLCTLEKHQEEAEQKAGVGGLSNTEKEGWRIKVQQKLRELHQLQGNAGKFTEEFLGDSKNLKRNQNMKNNRLDANSEAAARQLRASSSRVAGLSTKTGSSFHESEIAASSNTTKTTKNLASNTISSNTSIELTPSELRQLETDMRTVLSDSSHLSDLWKEMDTKSQGKISVITLCNFLSKSFPQLNNKYAVLAAVKQTCYSTMHCNVQNNTLIQECYFPCLLRNLFYFNTAYLVLNPTYNESKETFGNLTLPGFRTAIKRIGMKDMGEKEVHASFRKLERQQRKMVLKQKSKSPKGSKKSKVFKRNSLGPIVTFEQFCLYVAQYRLPMKSQGANTIHSDGDSLSTDYSSEYLVDSTSIDSSISGATVSDGISQNTNDNPFRKSPPKMQTDSINTVTLTHSTNSSNSSNSSNATKTNVHSFFSGYKKREKEFIKRKNARERRQNRIIEDKMKISENVSNIEEIRINKLRETAHYEARLRGLAAKLNDKKVRIETNQMLQKFAASEQKTRNRVRSIAKAASYRRLQRQKKRQQKQSVYGYGRDWSGIRSISKEWSNTVDKKAILPRPVRPMSAALRRPAQERIVYSKKNLHKKKRITKRPQSAIVRHASRNTINNKHSIKEENNISYDSIQSTKTNNVKNEHKIDNKIGDKNDHKIDQIQNLSETGKVIYETKRALKVKLKEAVEAENYNEAARLKEQIEALSEIHATNEEIERLEALKQIAIKVEDFHSAANIKSEIRRLQRLSTTATTPNHNNNIDDGVGKNIQSSAREFANSLKAKTPKMLRKSKQRRTQNSSKISRSKTKKHVQKQMRKNTKSKKKKTPTAGLIHVLTKTSAVYKQNPRVIAETDRATREAVNLFEKNFNFTEYTESQQNFENISKKNRKLSNISTGVKTNEEIPDISGVGGINYAALKGYKRRRQRFNRDENVLDKVQKYPGSRDSFVQNIRKQIKSSQKMANSKNQDDHITINETCNKAYPTAKKPTKEILKKKEKSSELLKKVYGQDWCEAPTISGLAFTGK